MFRKPMSRRLELSHLVLAQLAMETLLSRSIRNQRATLLLNSKWCDKKGE